LADIMNKSNTTALDNLLKRFRRKKCDVSVTMAFSCDFGPAREACPYRVVVKIP
jgi:hypothetical protein